MTQNKWHIIFWDFFWGLALALLLFALPQGRALAAEPTTGIREIIAPSSSLLEYDYILSVTDNYILAQQGGLSHQVSAPGETEYIVLDFEGNELLRKSEYSLYALNNTSLVAACVMIPTEDPRLPLYKHGAINLQGEVIYPLEYDLIMPAGEGLLRLQKDGKEGFGNEKGEIVISLQYDQIDMYFEYNLGLVQVDDVWYSIDGTETILHTFDADNVRTASFPSYDPELPLLRAKKDDVMGIIDWEGNIVVPFEYEVIKTYSEGRCWVKQNGLWGLLDTEGNVVLAPCYELDERMDRALTYSDIFGGIAVVRDKEGRWGCVNPQGELIVEFGFHEIADGDYYSYRPVRVIQNGLFGLIDSQGNIAVEPQYNILWPFGNDRGIACKDETWLLLNGSGEIIAELPIDISATPSYYQHGMYAYFYYDVIFIPQGEKYGLISRQGEILGNGYDTYSFSGSYILVQKDGCWGILEMVATEEADAEETENAIELQQPSTPLAAPETSLPTQPIILSIGSYHVTQGETTLPEPPQVPQIFNDRTMLPFNYLIEDLLGGTVSYDAATQTVTAEVAGHSYSLAIADEEIIIDSEAYNFGVAPYLIDDTVMVPLRAFEAVVGDLSWETEGRVIRLTP